MKGNMVCILSTSSWAPASEPLKGHGSPVTYIAFSPDSAIVASSARDGTIRLWKAATGASQGLLRVFHREVDCIAFSPDGERIVAGSTDGVIRTWIVESIMNTPRNQDSHGEAEVRRFALSGDGMRILVLTVDGKMSVWNALNGVPTSEIDAAEDVTCIAIDHGGQMIASGSKAGLIQVLRDTGVEVFRAPKHHAIELRSISLSPSGERVLSIGADDAIRICDQADCTGSCSIPEHSRFTHDLAFSDEELLVHTNLVGVVKIWKYDAKDIALGRKPLLVFHSSNNSPPFSLAEAATALRRCWSKSSTLWPISIERDAGDVSFESSGVYFYENGEKQLLSFRPSASGSQSQLPGDSRSLDRWEFCLHEGTFATIAGGVIVIGIVTSSRPHSGDPPVPMPPMAVEA